MVNKHNPVNDIDQLKEKLASYFSNNAYSTIQTVRKEPHLVKPWNDESISFPLTSKTVDEIIPVLNNVILPPRFVALYHTDSNTLECIYTVLDDDDPHSRRSFEFILDSKKYHCKFAKASNRLLILSKYFRRTGKYSAHYRNLVELQEFMGVTSEKEAGVWNVFMDMQPVSFFIDGFKEYNEETIVELANHINFYMLYYDRESPFIAVHPIETEAEEEEKQLTIVSEDFPEKISTRRKDQLLLDLAISAHQSTPRLQYMYYYQIIEYAAFYYIEEETRGNLLRVINSPDVQARPDYYIPQILEIVSLGRQEDEVKLEKVVKAICTPSLVWKEIEPNIKFFSKPHEFDGGFQTETLVDENITLESFCSMWHPKLANSLRYIRNALVHGREKRFGRVIAPTPRNDRLIKPWVNIIRRLAEEILIFEKLI